MTKFSNSTPPTSIGKKIRSMAWKNDSQILYILYDDVNQFCQFNVILNTGLCGDYNISLTAKYIQYFSSINKIMIYFLDAVSAPIITSQTKVIIQFFNPVNFSLESTESYTLPFVVTNTIFIENEDSVFYAEWSATLANFKFYSNGTFGSYFDDCSNECEVYHEKCNNKTRAGCNCKNVVIPASDTSNSTTVSNTSNNINSTNSTTSSSSGSNNSATSDNTITTNSSTTTNASNTFTSSNTSNTSNSSGSTTNLNSTKNR